MTPLESKVRLEHIRQAAEKILEITANTTYDEYATHRLLPGAVEREFTIIGEALSKAIDADGSLRERITNPGRVIAFRNQLAHNYPAIDHRIVWTAIHDHLPLLLSEVRALLAEP